jgi:hypothetical protein
MERLAYREDERHGCASAAGQAEAANPLRLRCYHRAEHNDPKDDTLANYRSYHVLAIWTPAYLPHAKVERHVADQAESCLCYRQTLTYRY